MRKISKKSLESLMAIKSELGLFSEESVIIYSALMAVRFKSIQRLGFKRYLLEAKSLSFRTPESIDIEIAKVQHLYRGYNQLQSTTMIGMRFLQSAEKAMKDKDIYDAPERKEAMDYDIYLEQERIINLNKFRNQHDT